MVDERETEAERGGSKKKREGGPFPSFVLTLREMGCASSLPASFQDSAPFLSKKVPPSAFHSRLPPLSTIHLHTTEKMDQQRLPPTKKGVWREAPPYDKRGGRPEIGLSLPACALDPTHVSSSLLEKKEASTSNQAPERKE